MGRLINRKIHIVRGREREREREGEGERERERERRRAVLTDRQTVMSQK